MDDNDAEYEEEEMVVLVELNGLVDDDLMKKGCTYQFVGIDQEKPILQLGKYSFLGGYEDQIGSALFLQQNTDAEGCKTWSKLCFSDKKLSMQRVFLRKKGAAEAMDAPAEDSEQSDDQLEGTPAEGELDEEPTPTASGTETDTTAGRSYELAAVVSNPCERTTAVTMQDGVTESGATVDGRTNIGRLRDEGKSVQRTRKQAAPTGALAGVELRLPAECESETDVSCVNTARSETETQ